MVKIRHLKAGIAEDVCQYTTNIIRYRQGWLVGNNLLIYMALIQTLAIFLTSYMPFICFYFEKILLLFIDLYDEFSFHFLSAFKRCCYVAFLPLLFLEKWFSPLCNVLIPFFFSVFKIFLCLWFLAVDYNIHRCSFLCIYFAWDLLSFLDLFDVFRQIWKVPGYYLFKYFFCPIVSLFSLWKFNWMHFGSFHIVLIFYFIFLFFFFTHVFYISVG